MSHHNFHAKNDVSSGWIFVTKLAKSSLHINSNVYFWRKNSNVGLNYA